MAHKKISFGSERPEPESLVRQREMVQQLASGVPTNVVVRVQERPPEPVQLPAVVPVAPPPVMAAPIVREETVGEDALARWLRRQKWERLALRYPGGSATISVFALHDTATHVHAAYDAKSVAFDLRQDNPGLEQERPPDTEGTCTRIELGWEDKITLWYRDTKCRVIFANGLVHFPGWPFHIISFFKAEAS